MDKTFPRLLFAVLDKSRHDRESFACGVSELDNYLHRQAFQDVERRAAVVYVAVATPPEIAGYYTLSQYSIELALLPEELTKRFSRYPHVSATLLGRLAVSSSMQGQGVGETLLMDALRRSLEQSKSIASAGVVVDGKSESAAGFYRRYGFVGVLNDARRLFLPMKTIEKMF